MPDGLAVPSPFGVPVDAFAGTGVEPGHAGGPRVGSVFAALDAEGQGVERGGVLEEVAQGAGLAGGLHAEDAARVGGAGEEDVSVGLEGGEQPGGLLRDQFSGGCPQLVELGADLVRYDFRQLVDVFLLVPDVGIAEGDWDGGELASTDV